MPHIGSDLSTIGFDPGMDVSAADLEIGNPNDYFEEWSWQWVDGCVLTWNVLFMHWMGDWYTPCVEVWVDAHTGEIQGGGMYRNAWDEEFGLHNIVYTLDKITREWSVCGTMSMSTGGPIFRRSRLLLL